MTKKDGLSSHADHIISPPEAQRRVTRFVLLEIGEHLCGGNPVEVREAGERRYWSVPVVLAIPGEARQKVGEILVDAVTGQLQVTDTALAQITAEAERMAHDLVAI